MEWHRLSPPRPSRRLLAGEDVVDLVLAPALTGDPLQLVGDRLAVGLVARERVGDRVRVTQRVGQRSDVHDRRVRALALVVEHGVGGVADEDDAVRVPRVDRVDVVDRPDVHLPHVQPACHLDDPLVEALHRGEDVVLRHGRRPGAVRIEGGDVERHLAPVTQRQQVDLGAAADVHPEVVVGDHPLRGVEWDDGAVGVLAREDRVLVAEELLADDGLDAVGSDHQVRVDRRAVGEGDGGVGAAVAHGSRPYGRAAPCRAAACRAGR